LPTEATMEAIGYLTLSANLNLVAYRKYKLNIIKE